MEARGHSAMRTDKVTFEGALGETLAARLERRVEA